MQVCNSFKLRLARVQSVVKNVVNRRLRKEKKRRSIQISEPFAFRHVTTNIKGLSEDELQVLREKAIASRFSTIDAQLAQQQQHDLHQKPARPNKTRAGYRGLTSSPLSASRPSITQSFAAEDSASQLSHTTASSSGGSDHGCDLAKETLI
ncbi:hypothetical protein N8I77_001520 [Diaporthe amygdali]|uniref:Uncharacterized protein n=1 Tax=Phomopsis amygdali TaxID=1214568 RepID=A0AAD9W8D4_PHOAM|nr:uncharacterized protein J7T55_012944 [Diaporthe amygdali]KAJ0118690.1 hypothetical protein J7T55_012944 [Diaporthe amygdali]KAK2614715.1 hypothetical protein N8I77_001520 [Diaporthe amygdali]